MVRTIDPEAALSLGVEINKRDDDRRLVFGYAKFAEHPEERGTLLVDRQGDMVLPSDLEDAAYEYVLTSRDAGEMHVTKGAGLLVESFVVTPEKLEKMGLPGDAVPQGWWVGYRVGEPEPGQPDPWDKIRSGEYAGFSIEGFGYRDEIPDGLAKGAHDGDDAPTPDAPAADAPAPEAAEPVAPAPGTPDLVAKYHVDLELDPWSDDGLPEEAFAERRQMLMDLQRENRITMAERDALLACLPPPAEYRALLAAQRAQREEATVLDRMRLALGLAPQSATESD